MFSSLHDTFFIFIQIISLMCQLSDKNHQEDFTEMSGKKGYIITTRILRLRCKHPEWFLTTQEFYNQILMFYYNLFLQYPELKAEGSQAALRKLEQLSIPGRDRIEVVHPLPWEKVPLYFRRAAANAGIAAAKSYLSKSENGYHRAAEGFHAAVTYYKGMYRDFQSKEITLRLWNGEKWEWTRCRLYGKEIPKDAVVMSPSVVLDESCFMLHVPIRQVINSVLTAKEIIAERRNVCGVHFANGDAFAVASVMNAEKQEQKVRYFKGGNRYRSQCDEILQKIEKSIKSQGRKVQGQANKKYWMKLKHLNDYYAQTVSRQIVDFCKEQEAGMIVFPKYDEHYHKGVMKGSGNFSPIHLSSKIREYLTYKAWKEGILVLDINAKDTSSVCAVCGQPIVKVDKQRKECICQEGHQCNRYLNTARNTAKKCLEQFQRSAGRSRKSCKED